MNRTSTGYMAVGKPPRSKPEFGISESELPAIKDWKIGGKYTMTLNVEMVSASKDSDYDAPAGLDGNMKKIHRARFKIMSVDAMPSKNAKEN